MNSLTPRDARQKDMEQEQEFSRQSRDLLIELRTEMKSVRLDISKLNDGVNARLSLLEREKLDRTEANRLQSESLNVHMDHEQRIRTVEAKAEIADTKLKVWGGIFGAGVIVVQTVLHFLLK